MGSSKVWEWPYNYIANDNSVLFISWWWPKSSRDLTNSLASGETVWYNYTFEKKFKKAEKKTKPVTLLAEHGMTMTTMMSPTKYELIMEINVLDIPRPRVKKNSIKSSYYEYLINIEFLRWFWVEKRRQLSLSV